jgi:hypothetical protein
VSNPTPDDLRKEFLKRFTGVNGKCRTCGAEPDQTKPALERAMWYATHQCEEEAR